MTESILNRFLDKDGKVTVWPAKPAHKKAVLTYLATKFEHNRIYTEKEVNEVLNDWHTFADWPLLRRGLVDGGYLSRDKQGYEYKLQILPD